MATVNTIRGAGKSSSTEWPLDTWIAPPSGETSRHWMDTASLLGLTSSMVESLASRIALRVVVRPQKTRATSGLTAADYLVRFDHADSSWRTSQGSLPGMETPLPLRTVFSLTLPRWVTWDEQGLSKHPTPVLHTPEPDGSAWPRPDTTEAPNKNSWKKNGPKSLVEAALLWTSPKARDGSKGAGGTAAELRRHSPDLNSQAKSMADWATPTEGAATGGNFRRGGARSQELLLAGQASSHPTDSVPTGAESLPSGTRRLNPTFVEWLMGIPWNWTRTDASDLQPWVTP